MAMTQHIQGEGERGKSLASKHKRSSRWSYGFVKGKGETAMRKHAVNFPPDLFDQIADAAIENNRSFSGQVVHMLTLA